MSAGNSGSYSHKDGCFKPTLRFFSKDPLGAPEEDWSQEKLPSLRQDWRRGAAAPPPREQKPPAAGGRAVNAAARRAHVKISVDGKEKGKKTSTSEFGVLNFPGLTQ